MKNQKGQILLFTLVIMVIVTSIVVALVNYTGVQIRSHRQAVGRVEGLDIAEAGIEAAVWKLNNQFGYLGETDTAYGNGTYDVTINDVNASTKLIVVDAYIPNSAAPTATRRLQAKVSINTDGVSFNYGAQIGEGGLIMDNNAQIIGNVWANGDMTGANGATITGTGIAADSAVLVADQINDTPIPPSSLINFRNAAASADAAQSFQISTTGNVNKVELYIRKVGAPPNFSAIRLVNNNAGNPGNVTIASGSLSAAAVSTSYGWVTVTFPTNPILNAGTTYWLVLDASGNSAANYYQWAANNAYAAGQAKTGIFSAGPWNATTSDGYFKLYVGGVTHTINSISLGADARANNVTNSNITANNYCQTGSGNNKVCDTSQVTPGPLAFPISAGNITDWEADAAAGGTIGNYTLTGGGKASLGPKKINGNLLVDNNAVLTLTGTLWVTGTVTISNNAIIKLDSGYGALSGTILAGVLNDANAGYIEISNNAQALGSGTAGSYLLLLSQRNNLASLAIKPSNNSGGAIYYAASGYIEIDNNASLKEVVANKLRIKNNAVVTYESGLASLLFTSGPGGSWEIQDQSWQLIQ